MTIQVFIQNEAGSDQKHYHDEKTLEYMHTKSVSRRYPFPYGFVMGTLADDDCCVDCFVITRRHLRTGKVITCEPIGLMEQVEDGVNDHNVLAKLIDEDAQVTPETEASLTAFVVHVFDHVDGKTVAVGRFLGAADARAQLMR
jgi:inorganic pyrophosphatase